MNFNVNTNYYDILGVSENATAAEIQNAFSSKWTDLTNRRSTMSAQDFQDEQDLLREAYDVLSYPNVRQAYDAARLAVVTRNGNQQQNGNQQNGNQQSGPSRVVNQSGANGLSNRARRILRNIGAAALALVIITSAGLGLYKWGEYNGSHNQDIPIVQDGSYSAPEEEYIPGVVVDDEDEDKDKGKTNPTTPSGEQNEQTSTQTSETNFDRPAYPVNNYGSVEDDSLVGQRADALVKQLMDAGITNPVTAGYYAKEDIVKLIKYANGVYSPKSMEEIDGLHLNLLNLLISPLNTDQYLYHVVYASGNDEFKDLAVEASGKVAPIDFATAFAEYGQNGVMPLTRWIQEKREEIYRTTNREEINKIYVEVGQVLADIMKGNGCTITLYEDKSEATYTFTSEQILANHASAMLLTVEAQLIFANHYEIRDDNDKVVESVQNEWKVTNKFNNGEPDVVTYDEINAWINNGCDYEWAIDSALIDGQTFGQRIQGDMEGMAQNNLAMNGNQTLTK